MGILECELRLHLKKVTEEFEANKANWISGCKPTESHDTSTLVPNAELLMERSSAAEKFREQGNLLMKSQQYLHALHMYSESISAAIQGPLASMAYFNRSTALFHMKYFEECIKDIDRALECGYPQPRHLYTLHLRKAQCLKFLKKNHEESLSNTLKAIAEHNKDVKSVRMLLKLALAKMDEPEPVLTQELLKSSTSKMPELNYGCNPQVPSFSSAVTLDYSTKFGRHVVANRDINIGDVLIVEDSIISSIFVDVHRDFCNFCFKNCISLIPCNICGFTMYCDEKCREKDWSAVHKDNCNKKIHHDLVTLEPIDLYNTKSSPSNVSEGLATYSLVSHLISFIGIEQIKRIAMENKPLSEDPITKGFEDGKFQEATLEALLSLDDNFTNQTKETLTALANDAIVICAENNIPTCEWLPIAAIIMKLCLVIEFNKRLINCSRVNYKADFIWQTVSLGYGLFLTSSMVNHSCDPNMYQVFYGTSTVFRAKRPIKKGDQLTCCYLEPTLLAARTNRKERQKIISQFFKFKCFCSACTGAHPLLHCLPTSPPASLLRQWFEGGSQVSRKVNYVLTSFYNSKLPATKIMMPQFLTLLQNCHDCGQTSNRWYILLQEIIKAYYKADGSCLFFDGSMKIFNGEEDYFKKDFCIPIDNFSDLNLS